MKQLFILCYCLMAVFSAASAQTEKRSEFLFDVFQEGIVYYRDGRQFEVPLNYNLVTNQYLFIDEKDDNQKKEFTESGMIVSIKIGSRSFFPPSEGAVEVIQAEPPFYVSYEGTIKREKGVAYGGKTQTASVDSYSQIRGVGRVGGMDGTEKSLAAINKVYQIKIGKKSKRFSSAKQFLKLFSKHKVLLAQYIEDKQVDFENINQVLETYNYACTLK